VIPDNGNIQNDTLINRTLASTYMKKGFSKEYVKASALEKVSCIATPGEKHFSVIQLPYSFANKRVWVLSQEYYSQLRNRKENHS